MENATETPESLDKVFSQAKYPDMIVRVRALMEGEHNVAAKRTVTVLLPLHTRCDPGFQLESQPPALAGQASPVTALTPSQRCDPQTRHRSDLPSIGCRAILHAEPSALCCRSRLIYVVSR